VRLNELPETAGLNSAPHYHGVAPVAQTAPSPDTPCSGPRDSPMQQPRAVRRQWMISKTLTQLGLGNLLVAALCGPPETGR
jgi:hypothetical protein